MKISKKVVIGSVVLFVIVLGACVVSIYQRDRGRMQFAESIASRSPSMDNINELRRSIAQYERRMEQYVQTAAQTGLYWKLLSARLQERGLHGEALEALQRAIYYNPEDPLLHYYTGVSAGTMAKSFHVFPGMVNADRNLYYTLAEESFLRAIELDNRYLRPRYSLGVLYVFDLDRPEDAIPHLELYLEISRNDIDTMFVLARANYMLRKYQAAVDLYERIIMLTTDPQKKTDAQNNRQIVLGLMYG